MVLAHPVVKGCGDTLVNKNLDAKSDVKASTSDNAHGALQLDNTIAVFHGGKMQRLPHEIDDGLGTGMREDCPENNTKRCTPNPKLDSKCSTRG